MTFTIQDPYRGYGAGDYALTDVKKIEGTEDFVELAETSQPPQCNMTRFHDCVMSGYLETGLQLCNCTPFYLRNYTKQVGHYLSYFMISIQDSSHSEFFSCENKYKQAGTELGQAQLPTGTWLYCD